MEKIIADLEGIIARLDNLELSIPAAHVCTALDHVLREYNKAGFGEFEGDADNDHE